MRTAFAATLLGSLLSGLVAYGWALRRRWLTLAWDELPVAIMCVAWRPPVAGRVERSLLRGRFVLAVGSASFYPEFPMIMPLWRVFRLVGGWFEGPGSV